MRAILRRCGTLALAATVGLAGCGDDEGDAGTSSTESSSVPSTLQVTSTDFVTVAPPTSTTSPPTTSTPPQPGDTIPTESTYTIVSGDFPSTVASRFRVSLDELLALNGLTLQGNQVPGWNVGTVIKIPPGAVVPGEAAATTTVAAAGDTTPDDSGGTGGTTGSTTGATTTVATATTVDICAESIYEIQAGDAPSTVAAKFDTTVEALAAANADTPNYASFIVGFEIKIPAKTDC